LFHAIDDERWFWESNFGPIRAKIGRVWWGFTHYCTSLIHQGWQFDLTSEVIKEISFDPE
jgi:hypothetical protein